MRQRWDSCPLSRPRLARRASSACDRRPSCASARSWSRDRYATVTRPSRDRCADVVEVLATRHHGVARRRVCRKLWLQTLPRWSCSPASCRRVLRTACRNASASTRSGRRSAEAGRRTSRLTTRIASCGTTGVCGASVGASEIMAICVRKQCAPRHFATSAVAAYGTVPMSTTISGGAMRAGSSSMGVPSNFK